MFRLFIRMLLSGQRQTAGTKTGYTERFRDLPLKGEIPAQPGCIIGTDSPRPDETDLPRGKIHGMALTKPQVCLHPPLVTGKMMAYIREETE